MGKIIRDRLQHRDEEESAQFEDEDVRDLSWNQEDGQDEKHIDKKEEILQVSQDGDSNKENVAEGKPEKAIISPAEEQGASLKEKGPEHCGVAHEQWPCPRCAQGNDDFTRSISDQCTHEDSDSVMPKEWWRYFQYDDESEKFLPRGSQTQRSPKPEEIVSHEPPPPLVEGASSETNTNKPIQELQRDERRMLPTLTERVEALRVQFDAVLERNKHLEESLAALTKKENALEVILDRQTQQVSSIDERQVEQERVLLAPMRNIYIRQFHDLIRESISRKMSGTFIYARQMWALKQRVNQHERSIRERLAPASDLWQFIKEVHAVAPKFFCKGYLWNKFLDLVLEDAEQLRMLGLSAPALELTRFGRTPPPGVRSDVQANRQDVDFRNELVFAEVVAGQSDELRPLYAELYEFFYKVPPETMYIKVKGRHSAQVTERLRRESLRRTA